VEEPEYRYDTQQDPYNKDYLIALFRNLLNGIIQKELISNVLSANCDRFLVRIFSFLEEGKYACEVTMPVCPSKL
jgi:hypothetical protein